MHGGAARQCLSTTTEQAAVLSTGAQRSGGAPRHERARAHTKRLMPRASLLVVPPHKNAVVALLFCFSCRRRRHDACRLFAFFIIVHFSFRHDTRHTRENIC